MMTSSKTQFIQPAGKDHSQFGLSDIIEQAILGAGVPEERRADAMELCQNAIEGTEQGGYSIVEPDIIPLELLEHWPKLYELLVEALQVSARLL